MTTVHNVLYILPDGRPKSSASYSARSAFKHCKRLFRLKYIQGWRAKREGAALDIGKLIEEAVKVQLLRGRGGRERWLELWDEWKNTPQAQKAEYTKVEESWENVRRIGDEWMQLFAIRALSYPFQNPVFQLPLSKKIFPGTSYDAISNTAYIDIFSQVDPNHPMLTKLEGPMKGLRGVITDVKTASKELPERLTILDPQLIEYAWMKQNPDVAFLWFVKKSHGSKFGSRVTLLQDFGGLKAGAEFVVLEKEGEFLWVGTKDTLSMYDKLFTNAAGKTITGKAATAVSAEFHNLGISTRVPVALVTKQLVQFASARIGAQELEDMGKVVGQVTVEMVVAHETDFYPMEPGVRYPSEKCPTCDMRFICSGDGDGRDHFLTRTGEEWLDSSEEL
jgi:hypothetical protein